jgi:hypothetical protein
MSSILDRILAEAAPAVDIWKQIEQTKNQRDMLQSEQNLNYLRAQADAQRASAEATAQQRAVLSQISITDDLKKWLSWAIAGLGLVASAIAVGTFLRKKRGKR